MAQVRALVRKLVLEELLSGEVLEVWIIDPAFAHAFVGQSVNMLEQKKPDHNCVAIPGRPPSLYSGAISPSMNSQSILPASCTSSCLMLMIWSSRARNRSPDPVVSCFFGRIAPSDAATESCFSIRGNRENEFASFQGLRHGNLAISSQQSRQKTTLAQWVRNSSRATNSGRVSKKSPAPAGHEADGVRHLKSPVSPSTPMHNAAFGSGRRRIIRQNENPARVRVSCRYLAAWSRR